MKLYKKAEQLTFISQINRDGLGVTPVRIEDVKHLWENPIVKDVVYRLHPLSITEGTFIITGFNSYVVKIT